MPEKASHSSLGDRAFPLAAAAQLLTYCGAWMYMRATGEAPIGVLVPVQILLTATMLFFSARHRNLDTMAPWRWKLAAGLGVPFLLLVLWCGAHLPDFLDSLPAPWSQVNQRSIHNLIVSSYLILAWCITHLGVKKEQSKQGG